jgi:hypothetical protein
VAETETVLPRRRLWVPAFVMMRAPTTLGEVCAYLNALLALGREDEAIARCPRWPHQTAVPLLNRSSSFSLPTEPDADGDLLLADWPVFGLRLGDALAMAAHQAAAKDGCQKRLLQLVTSSTTKMIEVSSGRH